MVRLLISIKPLPQVMRIAVFGVNSRHNFVLSDKYIRKVCLNESTTSSLSFRSGIVEVNEQASEREITCRVET